MRVTEQRPQSPKRRLERRVVVERSNYGIRTRSVYSDGVPITLEGSAVHIRQTACNGGSEGWSIGHRLQSRSQMGSELARGVEGTVPSPGRSITEDAARCLHSADWVSEVLAW